MPEPSLSEITNMPVDPDLGGGSPSVEIDHKGLLNELGQNARFRAQMNWNRYNLFLSRMSDAYKQIGDAAAMPVLAKDKPILQEKMGKLFEQISKDPKALFTPGPAQAKIQEEIAKFRSLSAKSKQDYLFLDAHDKFMSLHPELNTEENKKIIEGAMSKGIEDDRTFKLRPSLVVDEEKLFQNLRNPKSHSGVYEETKLEPTLEDGYLVSKTQKTYKYKPFITAWDNAFDHTSNKYGQTYGQWAKQQFEELKDLNPEKANEYLSSAKGNEKEAARKLWHDVGVMRWGGVEQDQEDEPSVTKKIPDAYELERFKQKNREKMEGIKFQNALAKMKKSAELHKDYFNFSHSDQEIFWKDKVKQDIEAAIENPDNAIKNVPGLEGQYKLNIPQAEMDQFKYKGGTGRYKIEKSPDFISYNPVDETLNAVFLTTDDSGNQIVDQKKTRKMIPDKYGDQIKLYYIGKSGFSKVQPKKVDQTPDTDNKNKWAKYKAK